MKKTLTINGYDVVQLLFVVVALSVVGIGAYLVIENKGYTQLYTGEGDYMTPSYPTPTLQDTYKYAGFAFPNMPSDYTVVGKDNSQPGFPEVEYVTTQSVSQVTTDAMNICKAHNFTAYNDQANGAGSTEGFGGVTFSTYGVECDASNNQWEFSFVNAAYMKYFMQSAELTVPTLTPQQQADIHNLIFLTISSDGTPLDIINSGLSQ